jgi:sulfur dioxygenase
VNEIDVRAAHEQIGSYRVIDVREPDELLGGKIASAENVPLGVVGAAAAGWDRNQPLLMVCRSGGRSGRAMVQLAQMGFTNVTNMAGGMLAWAASGLPTTTP